MKTGNDYSLWWLGGAVLLMASSITCISLLERRRTQAGQQRSLEEATERLESEGGPILANKSRVPAPVF